MASWFAEHWNYVGFLLATGSDDGDWSLYTFDILPELYHDELVLYLFHPSVTASLSRGDEVAR